MTEPLHIVHAIRSDAFAGVEQFVLRLALEQARHGHRVSVIGGDEARMSQRLSPAGVAFAPATRTIQTARAIRRAAADADIVNSHMTAADVAAVVALTPRRARPALVSTRHFASRRGRFRALPIDAFIGRRIDAEISISNAVAASIERPSTVVYSGVADAELTEAPRRRVVLMAQRLEAEKRTDLGLRAFAASGIAGLGWSLEIAGDGAERAHLHALAKRLRVDAQFLGFRDDLVERYRTAGLLLAPCGVEGLGLTVIEAMASGLPVVAADAGGHREILGGLDERALFSADDPQSAASALASLATDDPGRLALGRAGFERQRTSFSLAAQAIGTEAVYREALQRRAGAP